MTEAKKSKRKARPEVAVEVPEIIEAPVVKVTEVTEEQAKALKALYGGVPSQTGGTK